MKALWCMAVAMVGVCSAVETARAEAFPWVAVDDHVQLVTDPRVDLALRLYIIRQAREHIELALYEQGDDLTVGLPVLKALREAADRGVRVRIITQWFFQYFYHPLNQAPSFMTNPPAATPVEYVVFGSPLSVVRHGWHPSDGIHGKVLIVDGAYALVTGRGHAEMNLRWADSSHLLKGPLVGQSVEAFERLWPLARKYGEIITPTVWRPGTTPQQQRQILPPPDGSHQKDVDRVSAGLIRWLHAPAYRAPSEGPPANRARLLHTDFVAQMAALMEHGHSPTAWEDRMKVLNDPALDAMVERVDAAPPGSELRFSAMYAVLHPRMKNAVAAAARRGVQVTLFTNGDFETPPISTLGWFASVKDMDDLARAGVRVCTFKMSPELPWVFLHLKTMVVGDTVFFGSHNVNLASSVANDELFYEVEDPRLAAQSRAFFDALVKSSGQMASKRVMSKQRPLGEIGRTLMDPILGFW